jgi:hypothetical protein
MPFELEKKLYDALKGYDKLKHRIDGCGDKTCLVCEENKKAIADGQSAIREFEEKYGIDDLPF